MAYDCGISPIANLYVTVGGSGGGEKSVVNVFPVPASDQLSIQVVQDATDLEPATNQAFSFVLYNSMQLIVKSGDGANGVWDGSISDLPNGIYYLHVSTGQEILKKQLFVSN